MSGRRRMMGFVDVTEFIVVRARRVLVMKPETLFAC
jgi:hypothetical protein